MRKVLLSTALLASIAGSADAHDYGPDDNLFPRARQHVHDRSDGCSSDGSHAIQFDHRHDLRSGDPIKKAARESGLSV